MHASAVLLVLATLQPAAVAAGGGGQKSGDSGAPDIDQQDSVVTAEQAANFAIKEQQAVDLFASGGVHTDMPCPDGCGEGGPPTTFVLDTRPRQQARWFWCGPAAGQVVINWSRGFFFNNLNGENAGSNWKKQSTLATWMGTNDQVGTSGANLAATLNRADAVRKPVSTWLYEYRDSGTIDELWTKVVTDIYVYEMPLVMGVAPHLPGSSFSLVSWPNTTNAHHYIVISGYDGTSAATALVTYNDSASGYNGTTGAFQDTFVTMWHVNQDNQGKVIW
jgi:hypothetical protein